MNLASNLPQYANSFYKVAEDTSEFLLGLFVETAHRRDYHILCKSHLAYQQVLGVGVSGGRHALGVPREEI